MCIYPPLSQKQPHPLIFQNYPFNHQFFDKQGAHKEFYCLYNTLGLNAFDKFEGP
jgi:hypothetical protein